MFFNEIIITMPKHDKYAPMTKFVIGSDQCGYMQLWLIECIIFTTIHFLILNHKCQVTNYCNCI
jgi:hypothetical protein